MKLGANPGFAADTSGQSTHDTLHSDSTMTFPRLTIDPLTSEAFTPYGWVLGKPLSKTDEAPFFQSDSLSIWREHLFDTGAPNETEILWSRVTEGNNVIRQMETRRLTQQVTVPLTGSLIQIVAAAQPGGGLSTNSLRAFEIPVGMGTCLRPGCWHSTRALAGTVTAMMLSRRSTTYDLLVHLHTGSPTSESATMHISPHRIVAATLPADIL